jgi:hypothetical protein
LLGEAKTREREQKEIPVKHPGTSVNKWQRSLEGKEKKKNTLSLLLKDGRSDLAV